MKILQRCLPSQVSITSVTYLPSVAGALVVFMIRKAIKQFLLDLTILVALVLLRALLPTTTFPPAK